MTREYTGVSGTRTQDRCRRLLFNLFLHVSSVHTATKMYQVCISFTEQMLIYKDLDMLKYLFNICRPMSHHCLSVGSLLQTLSQNQIKPCSSLSGEHKPVATHFCYYNLPMTLKLRSDLEILRPCLH